MELLLASLINLTSTAVANAVLVMVNCEVTPRPPGLPSMVTKVAPLKSIVAVALALVIKRPAAPTCGRIVILLTAFVQAIKPIVIG